MLPAPVAEMLCSVRALSLVMAMAAPAALAVAESALTLVSSGLASVPTLPVLAVSVAERAVTSLPAGWLSIIDPAAAINTPPEPLALVTDPAVSNVTLPLVAVMSTLEAAPPATIGPAITTSAALI